LLIGVLFVADGDGPCDSEIANLDSAKFVDEYISWLNISVDQICTVDEFQTQQQIVDQYDSLFIRQLALIALQQVVQAEFYLVEDKEQLVQSAAVFDGFIRDEGVEQLNREYIVFNGCELYEDTELSFNARQMFDAFPVQQNVFNCHISIAKLMDSFVDQAIGP
jgi:hypothetical protein